MFLIRGSREQEYEGNHIVRECIRMVFELEESDDKYKHRNDLIASNPLLALRHGFLRRFNIVEYNPSDRILRVDITDVCYSETGTIKNELIVGDSNYKDKTHTIFSIGGATFFIPTGWSSKETQLDDKGIWSIRFERVDKMKWEPDSNNPIVVENKQGK